ncbi:MAG: UDP-N-acetylmuramate--L-alanine ligase [Actinomycetota bacterium]|nr:UDP-N-acetylmuramate--L-alanine ligase [Actinomycetota bacterium]
MLENTEHVHFIGIGGAGMSGIAKVLLEKGFQVSGSDLKESRYTKALRDMGAEISIGHDSEAIDEPDVVVVSTAIPEVNPELMAARERGLKVIRRAEMLAWLGNDKRSIAVAGTHGKTTTTSMISSTFDKTNQNPTFLIGGELNDIGSNAKYGSGEFFITEADESDGSLLYLRPEAIIITNIEADHLDYYASLEEIDDVFCDFVELLPQDGFVVCCGDDAGVIRLMARSDKRFITYGVDLEDGSTVPARDFTARNISEIRLGCQYDLYLNGEYVAKVELNVPGMHNIYNSLATIAISVELGLDLNGVLDALKQFCGVKRRFQLIGTTPDFVLFDDYAHHPTEVKATLSAAKSGEWKRLICIFQPHRYSRTKFLGKDFGASFSDADMIVLTDVYSAGEEPIPGVSGKSIVDALLAQDPRKNVVYLPNKAEIPKYLRANVKEGDLVLTMGAGDISTIGEDLLSLYSRNGCTWALTI